MVEAKITDISSAPLILKEQVFKNNSTKTASFDVSISDSVSNTIESNWSDTVGMTASQKVTYKAFFGEGETAVTLSSDFERGGSNSKTVTVGQSSGVQLDLGPGESVKALLSAAKGTMKVRVIFEAYLSGAAAINYNPTYKEHHFWAPDINGVRQAAGMASTVKIVNDIQVSYFSNGEITLDDLPTRRAVFKTAVAAAVA